MKLSASVARTYAFTNKFPESTMHWLVNPSLVLMCSKLESTGYLKNVENWIADDQARVEAGVLAIKTMQMNAGKC